MSNYDAIIIGSGAGTVRITPALVRLKPHGAREILPQYMEALRADRLSRLKPTFTN